VGLGNLGYRVTLDVGDLGFGQLLVWATLGRVTLDSVLGASASGKYKATSWTKTRSHPQIDTRSP